MAITPDDTWLNKLHFPVVLLWQHLGPVMWYHQASRSPFMYIRKCGSLLLTFVVSKLLSGSLSAQPAPPALPGLWHQQEKELYQTSAGPGRILPATSRASKRSKEDAFKTISSGTLQFSPMFN